MAEYRDPTLAPGATSNRTTTTGTTGTTTPRTGTTPTPTKSGMSRWIWIIAAAVVALVVLMMLFGGATEEAVEAPAGGDAVVTEPATPGVDPVAPAPAPAD